VINNGSVSIPRLDSCWFDPRTSMFRYGLAKFPGKDWTWLARDLATAIVRHVANAIGALMSGKAMLTLPRESLACKAVRRELVKGVSGARPV